MSSPKTLSKCDMNEMFEISQEEAIAEYVEYDNCGGEEGVQAYDYALGEMAYAQEQMMYGESAYEQDYI